MLHFFKLISIIFFSTIMLAQETDIKFSTTLGKVYKHEAPIDGLVDFTIYKEGLYFNYTALTDNMVFYPDIERSRAAATFYRFDLATLELSNVKDKTTRFSLFNQTDFRTRYNPIYDDKWIYDAYDYSEPDSIEEKVIYLFAPSKNDVTGDTVRFNRRESQFEINSQGFISDNASQKGMYYTNSKVNKVLFKLFYLEIQKNKIQAVSQALNYIDLGFDTDEIKLCQSYNYQSMGKVGKAYFITFYFNLNKDEKLGVATVFFDLENQNFRVESVEIEDRNGFLPDFSQVEAETKIIDGEITLFMEVGRRKVSQGDKTNTPYRHAVSDDLIIWKVGTPKEEVQFMRDARKGLELIFPIENGYVLVYNSRPEMKDLLETEDRKKRRWSFLSVVKVEHNKKYYYQFPLYEYSEKQPNLDNMSFYTTQSNSLSNKIDFYIYYSGEYYSGITDYQMQKVHLEF